MDYGPESVCLSVLFFSGISTYFTLCFSVLPHGRGVRFLRQNHCWHQIQMRVSIEKHYNTKAEKPTKTSEVNLVENWVYTNSFKHIVAWRASRISHQSTAILESQEIGVWFVNLSPYLRCFKRRCRIPCAQVLWPGCLLIHTRYLVRIVDL